ncbi:PREDICTED: transmembrane protein 45B-like isoform X2 [Priapulus caudatus]|uniref:Transmembrane protein 45B-like isoform X1 n=1 Tax=Priapulus caudatus TaxID=37621 RepID=A0ABM1DWY0_PRICU|nr:PREDICTED: transmembrane protein 45B-like isoform X1 [Priapulus caudatus]XP_014664458.1 PREDICTED: transmembrane protein 45B-like isoform X2 [Priapulus caudatus]XP_014664465.1 PREDICTED: transmembrane protein 45B-like isoform X2 [Priapulus caudatus]
MGSFVGHVIPGSMFFLGATWWTIQICYHYILSRQRTGKPFRCQVTFPGPGKLKHIPFEGIVKLVLCGSGIAGEVITAFQDGKFVHLGNAQHSSMYFFFALSGAIDVLVFYRVALPAGIDYVALCLGFFIEGLLFVQHLHGRSEMNVQLHVLLYYTVFACALSTLLEMRYRCNALTVLARAFFTLIQGTWFMQAALVLYNPLPGATSWDESDHGEMMMITVIYTWHYAANIVYMMMIYALVRYYLRRRGLKIESHEEGYAPLDVAYGYELRQKGGVGGPRPIEEEGDDLLGGEV